MINWDCSSSELSIGLCNSPDHQLHQLINLIDIRQSSR
jgi:hypothetical protein